MRELVPNTDAAWYPEFSVGTRVRAVGKGVTDAYADNSDVALAGELGTVIERWEDAYPTVRFDSGMVSDCIPGEEIEAVSP